MESDLTDLLAAWLGRETDQARREELLARLQTDDAFRREFVGEIRMHGTLKTVQSAEPRWLRLEDELGWSVAHRSSGESLEDRIVGRLPEWPRRRRSVRWLMCLTASAVSAAVLAVAVRLSMPLSKVPTTPPVPALRPFPKADATTGLAMITRLDEVVWKPDEPHPSEGDVVGAGRLRLISGHATLSMLTGVVLDVEAPADFEILKTDRVFFHHGRVRARVPAGAEGFLVLGPRWAVVDLGTEFAINVDVDGKLIGRVFKGRAEAALLTAAGSPERSYLMDSTDIGSSTAVEIDARTGLLEPIADPGDFAQASRPVAPSLKLGPYYAAAVLQSKPWGYWKFESMEGGAIPNEVAGHAPLQVTGTVRLDGPTGGNRWADFPAAGAPQFLEMQHEWHPARHPGYAVELWCLSESIAHSTLVSLATHENTRPHIFLVELTARNRLTMHKPASVRVLRRWRPGGAKVDEIYSRDPYVPFRWCHIVAQIRGEHIELFMDGLLASSISIDPRQADVPCHFVLGRLTGDPTTGISTGRPFVGRMDEVAVYDRPLTDDEIQNHYRLGAPRIETRSDGVSEAATTGPVPGVRGTFTPKNTEPRK